MTLWPIKIAVLLTCGYTNTDQFMCVILRTRRGCKARVYFLVLGFDVNEESNLYDFDIIRSVLLLCDDTELNLN